MCKQQKNLFAISEVPVGKLNALVKNILKQTGVSDPNEAIRLVNSGEWILVKAESRWREKNGIIYLSVVSDGTTGSGWIKRLEGKKCNLSKWAKDLLRSLDFKPTTGVKYELAILKGKLYEDSERVTKKIRVEAGRRGLSAPNPEIACLIRGLLSDEEIKAMGLIWIVTMHEPIKDSGEDPFLLIASRNGDGRWLDTNYGYPSFKWGRSYGFAFVVSQVSTSP